MFKNQAGVILYSILIVLIVLSFVGSHVLNIALQVVQRNELTWQKHRTEAIAHQVLQSIEKKPLSVQRDCLISLIAARELAKKPLAWWQHRCSGNLAGIRYYYCLELLANTPCAQGNRADQTLFNATFHRISVLALPPMTGARIILQSVVVSAQPRESICTEQPRVVALGRQMWRTL